MVYLGGPTGPRRRRGIYLHDPPPGYHPPRPKVSLKDRRRQAREDWVLLRVMTVVLVLLAVAVLAIICVIIVTHG
jgi:hypothetical protein